MNFLQLEYFLTILKFNSISKAASELYITQPALSQQLIHLEKELATKLFYRKGNSLILTEAGERFRDSAQNMLYEYRTMQTMMAELKDNGSFCWKTVRSILVFAIANPIRQLHIRTFTRNKFCWPFHHRFTYLTNASLMVIRSPC